MGKKNKSFCTDKDSWDFLDIDEFEENQQRKFCVRTASGRICKKSVAQIMENSKYHSSQELACNAILFRSMEGFTKNETKAFGAAFEVGRATYDKELNIKLLTDNKFANNAKIILLLRSFEPEVMADAIAETFNVKITARQKVK